METVGGEKPHPARFPAKLPEFFIHLLTEPGDVVLDIFAGSNTTGQVAEAEGRRWLAFELSSEYVGGSAFRFLNQRNTRAEMRKIFDRIQAGETVDLNEYAIHQICCPSAQMGVSGAAIVEPSQLDREPRRAPKQIVRLTAR